MSEYESKNDVKGWFSQAGSLDGSLDGGNDHDTVSIEPTPVETKQTSPNTTSVVGSAYIKPVKGINGKKPAPRYEPKPIETINVETNSVKSDSKTTPVLPVEKENNSYFTVKNISKVLAIVCLIVVFLPSFLVSCSGQTYNVDVLQVATGNYTSEVKNTLEYYADARIAQAHPFYFLCILIPIAVVLLLFINKVVDSLKAKIIIGAVAVDLLVWYRLYSQVKNYASQLYSTVETTAWFKIDIACLILILIISILIVLHVFEMDTDIIAKIKNSKMSTK